MEMNDDIWSKLLREKNETANNKMRKQKIITDFGLSFLKLPENKNSGILPVKSDRSQENGIMNRLYKAHSDYNGRIASTYLKSGNKEHAKEIITGNTNNGISTGESKNDTFYKPWWIEAPADNKKWWLSK